MAFSASGGPIPITRPSGRNEFFVDFRKPCRVIPFTKLTGDTTGTLNTNLQYCREIIILKADLTEDTAAVKTTGFGSNGATFSSALTSLSTGYTAGYAICIGGKN